MGLYANPNPPPEIYINEFMFTSSINWQMEVYFYYCDFNNFDSVCVKSSAGSARILTYNYFMMFYITDSCLSRPLTINTAGDTISIEGYNSYYYVNVSSGFSFGNYPHSIVNAPALGQSISRFDIETHCLPYYNVYSLSLSPSMGEGNDTTGAMSSISGIVYDMYGNPVPNETFNLDFNFTTDSTGHYSTRIYSRNCTRDTLCYQQYPGQFNIVTISPLSYAIEPDTVITQTINLTSNIITGISPESENTGQDFKVFPNPVKNLIMVSYSTDLGVDSGDLSLIIYDISGKQVLDKKLENSLGVANIPSDLANGMYLAALKDKGKTLGMAHFVVDK